MMRRANYWTGVIVLVTAVTLPLLTVGCTQDNSQANTGGKSALTAPAVGDQGLPEVVVSASRSGPETIAMSDRNANAAEQLSPTRAHRP
jgi:hypothetical protein